MTGGCEWELAHKPNSECSGWGVYQWEQAIRNAGFSWIRVESDGSYIGHYIHGTKIGVAILLQKENEDLAKDICMHIAAMKPESIDINDLDKNFVEKS